MENKNAAAGAVLNDAVVRVTMEDECEGVRTPRLMVTKTVALTWYLVNNIY